jgi:hypothetical protein
MQSWGYLLEKHKESYIRFAPEVLLLKEKECGNILLDNWKIENSIAELSIRAEKQRTIKERLETAIANVPEVSSSHNPADIEHELLLRGELERDITKFQLYAHPTVGGLLNRLESSSIVTLH